MSLINDRCLNVKLQKQLSRKTKGKSYPKYVMTIPPRDIEELGWQKGMELEVTIDDNKLIIQPKKDEKKNEE
jgi:antitoxin component of MazEF toxin-antitoxin module